MSHGGDTWKSHHITRNARFNVNSCQNWVQASATSARRCQSSMADSRYTYTQPMTVQYTNTTKARRLPAPTQEPMKTQWWSSPSMHLAHLLQWCAVGGLAALHRPQKV
eukprot:CAMPEP_0206141104 /NCGR_PEP_ID=MMETSP1473-20131121/11795_1 /ASSEMBLY_ACC=CAM_ASM_001109 /TAXON_ID=1461547 /ORGANISM="Stichococcus sp, Strain RCC1054" /LENGTH=107 /DNA_ID=CAMNT_0053535517 /DNA_START=336 /DNA_END=659 /DNA_ORIENTATION=-